MRGPAPPSFLIRAGLSWPCARAIASLLAVLLAGCATTPPSPSRLEPPVYYPAPPARPRLQYLTSISSSADVVRGRGWFLTFLLGKEKPKDIIKPYGLDVWQDRIYICDTALGALAVVDLKWRQMRYVSAPGKLAEPINVAIDEDGTKYVADSIRGVVIFDSQDRYIGGLAVQGQIRPTDIVISGDRLFVTDLASASVRIFDKTTGQALGAVPIKGEKSLKARLQAPVNLAVDKQGNLYVSDMGLFQVLEYDTQGRYLRSFGSQGDSPGQFARPKGIALDDDGRLYVVDAAAQVVQIFDQKGQLLLYFGEEREDGPSLSLPAKVRLNKSLLPYFQPYAASTFNLQYLVLVSSQYGDHKISVYGVGG